MIAEKQWREIISQTLRPRPCRDLWKWTDANIILPAKESSGRATFDHTFQPTTAWVWDTYLDPTCREAYFLKPPQYGMSIRVLILLCWIILNDPKNFLYIIDSKQQAKDLVDLRFLPLLKNCRQYISRRFKTEDDDAGGRLMDFGDMYLYLTGSYSSGDISSKPFSVVILDEWEKHPRKPGGEASTGHLARDRVKNAIDSYILGFSSLRDHSRPEDMESELVKSHDTGTCEKYQTPCPACGKPFVWEFELLRFDHHKHKDGTYDLPGIIRDTRLECLHCNHLIHEKEKPNLIPHGSYQPTNPDAYPGIRSASISDIYSRAPNQSWGNLVLQSFKAQKDPVARQAFFLTNLVRPLTSAQLSAAVGGYALRLHDIQRLRGNYQRGTLPIDPALLVLAVDTQDDFLKWAIHAFDHDGKCYIIDYDIAYDFARIDDTFTREFSWKGQPRLIDLALIDEGGHRGMEVRRYCLDRRPFFTPCRGRSSDQIRKTVQEMRHGVDGRELLVYWFDAWSFQRDLYIKRLRRQIDRLESRAWETIETQRLTENPTYLPRPFPKNLPPPEDDDPPIIFPADAPDKFLQEYISEWWDPETRRWERDLNKPNDFADTTKMALVAWSLTARTLQNDHTPIPEPSQALSQKIAGSPP